MTTETVFLTGSTGFIGFVTLRRLLESGYKVRTLVRKQQGVDLLQNKFGQKYGNNLEVIIASGSFEDEKTFEGNILEGVSYIIHMASPMNTDSSDYINDIINPAVKGTLSVLKAAKNVSSIKRVVITSSGLALFSSGPDSPKIIDENNWANYDLESASNDAYAHGFEAYCASKTIAEKEVWKFVKAENPLFDVNTVIPTLVVGRNELAGKGEFVGYSNSVIFGLLTQAATFSPVFFGVVDVLDVAEAHIRALNPEVPGNERYILCSGEGSFNEAIEVAKELKPDYEWNFGSYVDAPYKFINEKAVNVLGMKFNTYKQAVRNMLAGYFGLE